MLTKRRPTTRPHRPHSASATTTPSTASRCSSRASASTTPSTTERPTQLRGGIGLFRGAAGFGVAVQPVFEQRHRVFRLLLQHGAGVTFVRIRTISCRPSRPTAGTPSRSISSIRSWGSHRPGRPTSRSSTNCLGTAWWPPPSSCCTSVEEGIFYEQLNLGAPTASARTAVNLLERQWP